MSSAGSLTVMPFSTSSRMRFQRAAGNEVGDFDPGKNLVIVFNRGQQFVQMLRRAAADDQQHRTGRDKIGTDDGAVGVDRVKALLICHSERTRRSLRVIFSRLGR